MTTQAEIRQAWAVRQEDFETLFNNILAAADGGDYHKTTRGMILLADQLTEHESIGTWLDIGEFGEFTLADLVIGGFGFTPIITAGKHRQNTARCHLWVGFTRRA